MHCKFLNVIKTFQMRFDVLLASKGNIVDNIKIKIAITCIYIILFASFFS